MPNKLSWVFSSGHVLQITKRLDSTVRHYTPVDTVQYMCCHCKTMFSKNSSSGNIMSHLKKKHNIVDGNVCAPLTFNESVSVMATKKDMFTSTANELLLQVICSTGLTCFSAGATKHIDCDVSSTEDADYSPLDDMTLVAASDAIEKDTSFVGGDFFRFCKHISCGQYVPPSRNTLQKKLIEYADELQNSTKIILQNMGVNFGPSLATDVWTSKAGRSYYGQYLHFITKDWEMVGVPIGLTRISPQVSTTECITKDKSNEDVIQFQEESIITSGKTGAELAAISKCTLSNFGINYAGCKGGFNCRHAVLDHTTRSTEHHLFANVSDSGGSDPVAAAISACNATRCTAHCIHTVFKATVDEGKTNDPELQMVIDVIEKIRALCTTIKRSSKLGDAFHDLQLDLINRDVDEPRLYPRSAHVVLLAMITRWGSCHDMIERILEPCVERALALLCSSTTARDSGVGLDRFIFLFIYLSN
jgi:hypothetical protein